MLTRAVGAVGLVALACTQDVVLFDTAPPPGGGGGVSRVSLSLTFVVEAADSSVAAALGWAGGRVPDADVTVRRTSTPVATFSATTDTLGTVRFDSLLTGNYEISTLRLLSVGEASRLAPQDADVDAVAAGGALSLGDSGAVRTVGVYASRRGSLVVSELWAPSRVSTTGDFYPYATYLELYNNADTTVFLDGMLVGQATVGTIETMVSTCAEYEPWNLDSLGIWAQFIYQFPGTGADYPLVPGQSVSVLATDAIDHRTVGPEAEDLSGASFEFEEGPDNPSVPNLVNVGTRTSPFGNGVVYYANTVIAFVAAAVNPDSLPLYLMPHYTLPHKRIPAAAVLDVAGFFRSFTSVPCPAYVHPRFLRQAAEILPRTETWVPSIQRRVLRTLSGGRRVLLRTLVMSRDFAVTTPRTPGSLP
jgi:hypothetical protein